MIQSTLNNQPNISDNVSDNPHHEHLIKEITEMFRPVLDNSPQAVYIYLDDTHKICNKKFADMLGYDSVEEWVDNQYPVSDVDEKDQSAVINAYMNASRNLKASKTMATVKNKNGKKINTEIIMAPIAYQNEIFVLHFINEI